jgi:hypothetical protein
MEELILLERGKMSLEVLLLVVLLEVELQLGSRPTEMLTKRSLRPETFRVQIS